MVWLYVGGLVADVTAAALAERFAAFGTVRDCQLPADKPVHGATDIPARGFGFVDLDETDETSLRRCISLYNGCKWRGHTLRVELAKPSMLARLEQELRDQAKADTEADAMVAEHSQRANVESGAVLAREPEVAPLNITSPTGKAVLTAINQKRKMFPPYATQTKDQLNWQASMAPIKQPAASAASQSSKPVTSRKQEAHAGDAPVNTTARAEALRQPADRKQRQHRPAESAAEAHARPPAVDRAPDKDASLQGGQPMPASSDEQLDVVDFMTADDGTASAPAPAPAPAHAYDSSDADEPVGQPSKRSRSEAPQEQGLAHVANGRSQKQPSHRSEQLDVRRRGSVLSNLAMIRLTDEQEAAVLAEFAHAAMEDLDGNSDSSVSDEDEAGWELEEAESEELGKLQHLHACQCIDCAA